MKVQHDYYELLGVDETASRSEIEKEYKRQASKHHPDRGGSEETMKSLNEAYRVLRSDSLRQEYDQSRNEVVNEYTYIPVQSAARDVGVFGHSLSALLCLVTGTFLLLLVHFQWIWFLWPLAILAVFVIGFGVLMARSAMIAANATLPASNFLRRYYGLQEVLFWVVVGGVAYGFYWVLGQ